jgi:hypothetical protein
MFGRVGVAVVGAVSDGRIAVAATKGQVVLSCKFLSSSSKLTESNLPATLDADYFNRFVA